VRNKRTVRNNLDGSFCRWLLCYVHFAEYVEEGYLSRSFLGGLSIEKDGALIG
jgi:hypothetical protein